MALNSSRNKSVSVSNSLISFQILGLTTEYRVKGSTHRYIRKLLALPFIPAEQITETFEILKEVATEHLQPLTDYIDRTWINSNIWGPENWCVFGQSVRTNNDVEGKTFLLLIYTLRE